MRKNTWLESENALLLKLKNKNLSYKEINEILPKGIDALRNRYWILKQKEESWIDKEVIGFLDIEVSNLKADVGYILSWALRVNGETKSAVITKREIFNGSLDKRIIKELLKELALVDTVVTYYGSRMDLPFIRTRSLINGLDFPIQGLIRHIDLYYQVKYKLQLHRNSLDAACSIFELKDKTRFDVSIWQRAALGDKACLAEILNHNIIDVELTENLFNQIKKFGKFTRKSI